MKKYKAAIFDLDGVLVSTDIYHYRAWKALADREHIYFDKEINDRLRGVSRRESLMIILERASKIYEEDEILAMMEYKNNLYVQLLDELDSNALLPGALELLDALDDKKVKKAIGSSSKNTTRILQKTGILDRFDAIADGRQIKNTKPDPEVFLLAAKLLQESPENCLVFEDALAGIQAAKSGNMGTIAVGGIAMCAEADGKCKDLNSFEINAFF